MLVFGSALSSSLHPSPSPIQDPLFPSPQCLTHPSKWQGSPPSSPFDQNYWPYVPESIREPTIWHAYLKRQFYEGTNEQQWHNFLRKIFVFEFRTSVPSSEIVALWQRQRKRYCETKELPQFIYSSQHLVLWLTSLNIFHKITKPRAGKDLQISPHFHFNDNQHPPTKKKKNHKSSTEKLRKPSHCYWTEREARTPGSSSDTCSLISQTFC